MYCIIEKFRSFCHLNIGYSVPVFLVFCALELWGLHEKVPVISNIFLLTVTNNFTIYSTVCCTSQLGTSVKMCKQGVEEWGRHAFECSTWHYVDRRSINEKNYIYVWALHVSIFWVENMFHFTCLWGIIIANILFQTPVGFHLYIFKAQKYSVAKYIWYTLPNTVNHLTLATEAALGVRGA